MQSLSRVVLLLLLLLVVAESAKSEAREGVPARPDSAVRDASSRVLVLYSDDRLFRANVVFDADVRQALSSIMDEPVECYSEFLDDVFFPAGHQERMLDFLLVKYRERTPDVIVAFASSSLDFCLRHRDELFPHVPVIFAAIDRGMFSETELEPRVTGVRSSIDVHATLRLALQLHPQTQRVCVVGDSVTFGNKRPAIGWADFDESEFDPRFEYILDLSTPELLDRLEQLPEHSLVLYVSTLGRLDTNLVPAQVLVERMAQVTKAPIYATLDAFLGHGILGAVTTPTVEMARRTAELVAQVLALQSDQPLPSVQTLEAVPIFDWRQMQRWDIREGQLPPRSIVLFGQPSLWQRHSKWLIAATAVFLVQSGLILALVLQSVRRRRAEREALRRRQELAHATRVATIGELTASLAHEINQPLAAILSNTQAAQRLLDAGAPNGSEIREILDDIAADDQRAGEVIRRVRALLRKGETEPATLNLNELVSEVADLVHGEVILQNVTLALELSPGALSVSGDRVQLQQVLLNLIMNAIDSIKEATNGERKLLIRTTTEKSSVRVSVIDTGVGVEDESIERIFDRFVTTKPHGMGLGLAICRSIVEMHGGHVGGMNNPGRGATFWFDVPALGKVKK